MTTGYFTTDPDGRLTDDSTLEVDGHTYPIPARTDRGGQFAPIRIAEALRAAGYKAATDYYGDLGTCDGRGITIELERV